MSNVCTCDNSPLFPRCHRYADFCDKQDGQEAGYSTGKWSDDDDWNPITPFMGPNR